MRCKGPCHCKKTSGWNPVLEILVLLAGMGLLVVLLITAVSLAGG